MGTWGVGPFENDDAADWAWELAESPDLQVLADALEAPLSEDADEFLEASAAQQALAAAEVVAAMLGRPAGEISDEVKQWIAAHRKQIKQTSELVETAMEAVARVAADSELRDLWEESDDFDAWIKSIEHLQKRLSNAK